MRHARRNALREADCVLLAGVPCDFRLDYGQPRAARGHADRRQSERERCAPEPHARPSPLIGDAGLTLEALAHARRRARAPRPTGLRQLRARDDEREREIDVQAARAGDHVNPIAFFRALDRVAGEQRRHRGRRRRLRRDRVVHRASARPAGWLDPGAFGTLGVGAGFALGAQLVRPQDEVWLIWGDGASGYGLVEFDTFVRHGVPVIAVVGNDASWAQIAREQVKMLDDDVATVLARSDYHAVVAGLRRGRTRGAQYGRGASRRCGRHARSPARGRPVLVNVWLDRTDFREGSISM